MGKYAESGVSPAPGIEEAKIKLDFSRGCEMRT